MTPLWMLDRSSVPSSPFEPGAHHDVIVVGAGITGLSTALMLARDGMDVVLVDSGDVANGSTGANTGKLSLLQGSVLSTLRSHHPAALVRAYVEANRAGAAWLEDFADSCGVPLSRHPAYSYVQSDAERARVDEEFDAASEAGLAVRRVRGADLSDLLFPFVAAVALDDQLAIDPVRVADALARALVAAGGTLHTGVRVTGAHALPHPRIDTEEGPVFADHIVLATGTPILDRGLTFAKTRALRSYCVSFRIGEAPPDGLFLSLDAPSRSIRPVGSDDGPATSAQLIVGGNGHPVGRGGSERARIDDIVAWTRQHWPDAQETHRWSAQDYESHNLVPFVGALPRGLGRIRFATGYGKWGLSNGPAAGLRLAAEIRGVKWRDRPRWMITIGTRITVPADLGRGAVEAGRVAGAAMNGWLGAESRAVPVPRPTEGQGVLAQRAGQPVGVSTVDGETRAVSAVCPHLGGVVKWNDAECTWDCPLHGSRFAPDGTRVEGPAVADLRRLQPRHPAAGEAAGEASDGARPDGIPSEARVER